MKITLKAILIGVLVGGAISFAFGMLDGFLIARGGEPIGWALRVGVGTSLGVVTMLLVSALSGNKALRLAPAADDKRAKTFAPDPGRGVIYVFRAAFVGKLVGLDLLVDGRPVAQTRGKTFVRLDLAPGDHTLASVHPGHDNQVDLRVSAPAGSIVYVEQSIRMGALQSGPALALADNNKSQARIRRCRLLASQPT